MRSLISISLSLLLLLQTVNFGATEVFRLGDLLEHAELHSKEYGDSFLSFLEKHYGSSREDHLATHEGHEKLPFNHDSMTKSTISVFFFYPRQVLELPETSYTPRATQFFYAEIFSFLVEQDIYQPPKMA